jgi:hypothetical protein
MTDTTYNGWTNRPTWLVNIWLSNDQVLDQAAREACNQPGEMLQEAAQTLENMVDDLFDVTGFTLDLINCTLVQVNWLELVQAFREAD